VKHEANGIFEQAVLIAVTALGDAAAGNDIAAEVRRRLQWNVHSGAVHATLHQLEKKKLVRSQEQPGHYPGRTRRAYSITAEGRRALQRAKERLERTWSDFG
jgi:DNA-binding PadR family transcriptional regulator